jgi:NADH dehydrogenase
VTVKHGDVVEEIGASTVIWGAGVQASPLAATLAKQTGAALDRAGRIAVGPDLTLPGHPEVFVIGDMALAKTPKGDTLPGVAPVAMQQGDYVAGVIRARLKGKESGPFVYWDKGSMATIGRAAAVAETNMFGFPLRINGFLAWLGWLFIHILYLVQFENRLLVLWQWFWNYVTRNRSARLITGTSATEGLKEGVKDVDDAPPPPPASPLPNPAPLGR